MRTELVSLLKAAQQHLCTGAHCWQREREAVVSNLPPEFVTVLGDRFTELRQY